jgi:hypothetical protein
MVNNKTLMRFKTAPINSKEIKYNIYAPLNKINTKEKNTEHKVFEDDDFLVKLQGSKLTQVHKDIMDIILFFGNDYEKNGMVGKSITFYQIQKHLQYKSKSNNNWVKEKLNDLKRTTIEIIKKIDVNKKQSIEISILRATLVDEEIEEYAIIFEEMYFLFFENFVSINYKNILNDILKLENGVTKATVRYLLTFKAQQINIDKLLDNIGISGSEANKRKHRSKLLDELEKSGNLFGIELIKGKYKKDCLIRYKKPESVKFYYPTNQ